MFYFKYFKLKIIVNGGGYLGHSGSYLDYSLVFFQHDKIGMLVLLLNSGFKYDFLVVILDFNAL